MDWNTRIEVTPVGRYVSRLHRADQQLDRLTYPGLSSADARIRRVACDAVSAANALRETLRDELARFGGLPIGTPADEYEASGYPTDYDGPGNEFTPEMMAAMNSEDFC